ncbi:MAG: hypothetical protein Pg6C_06490 [Treponemataceae bacterium]|nr:MAG: hypothetical protein Pg6C_06490 [Treponemataceae bacterium]
MRRILFLACCMGFFFCAFTLFSEEPDYTGAALSDAVSSKLKAADFPQEFLFATGEQDGFPYTITVTFPAVRENTQDSPQKIDTVVIAAIQDISYIDSLIEFMEKIGRTERAITVRFVLTANDISVVDGSWTLNGTKRFVETLEDTDSVCALLLMRDKMLTDSSVRLVPVSTLPDNMTLTPLWLIKALPFKQPFPFFIYRLNLTDTDGRLSFFALNEIPSAGIIFGQLAQSALYDGLIQFIDMISTPDNAQVSSPIDFSQTESNYLTLPNIRGNTVFFYPRARISLFLFIGHWYFSRCRMCFPFNFHCRVFCFTSFKLRRPVIFIAGCGYEFFSHTRATQREKNYPLYFRVIRAVYIFVVHVANNVFSARFAMVRKKARRAAGFRQCFCGNEPDGFY